MRYLLAIVGLFFLSSCAPTYMEAKQEMMPIPRPQTQPAMKEPGSLFSDQAKFASMFVDKKGRSIGDVITIKIVESSSASNSTDTQTGRKSDLQAGVSSFLGLQNYPFHHYLTPFGPVAGNFQNSFQGGGKTERKNTVLGTITATVVEVLPNENLRVMGSREVVVNNEKQLLTISGIVREKDIADDNTVLSTYLAEAKIYYTGSGDLAENQRRGWLSRILGTIWPF